MNWRPLARLGLATMTSLVLLTACASVPGSSGGHAYPVTIDEIPDN